MTECCDNVVIAQPRGQRLVQSTPQNRSLFKQTPPAVQLFVQPVAPLFVTAERALRMVTGGTQGPRGVIGPVGIDLHYTHNQLVPAATWNVVHNLNKHPSVTVVDSAGTEVSVGVAHLSVNALQIDASTPFSGKAYLN